MAVFPAVVHAPGIDIDSSAKRGMTTMTTGTDTMHQRPIPWMRIARVVGGIAAAVSFAYGALIALFVGAVITSGCFFECNDPNPVGGVPILALAAVLAGLTVATLVWAVTQRTYWPLVKHVGSVVAGIGFLFAIFAAAGMG